MLLTWKVWLANNASLHFHCFGVLQPCGKMFWPCNIYIFMVFEHSNLKHFFCWIDESSTIHTEPYMQVNENYHTKDIQKLKNLVISTSDHAAWVSCVRNVNVHTVQMHFIQAHMQEHTFYVYKVLVLLHQCRGTGMVVAIRKFSRCSVSIRSNSAITFTVESDTIMSRYELIV